MTVAYAEIRLFAPWVHSLKEKRMELQSLMVRTRAKFNVSVAEADTRDKHQILTLAVAAVTGDSAGADRVLDHVLRFIQENTEAEITDVFREHR